MNTQPTMSKDGVARFNMRVNHRIGRDDLIRFLAFDQRYEETFDSYTSQRAVLDTVRFTLLTSGSEAADYWRDGVTEEDADAVEAWATETVDRLFPELRKD